MKRVLTMLLFCSFILSSLAAPAAAMDERALAVQYLVERKIYQGDQNGNLNLDSGLTRAELATILTRLDFVDAPGGLDEWKEWGEARFRNPETRLNKFTDVPDWALPQIEYCYQLGLMKGVSETLFAPQSMVTPQMACTVMLRYCGVPDTDWDYATSVAKAQGLGIAPNDNMNGDMLPRGTMAIIVYRGIQYAAEPGGLPDVPDAPSTPSKVSSPDNETSAMTIDEMKAEIVRLTNAARIQAGLSELEVLPELMECAQAKADDMYENHYYGHNSPVYGTFGEMMRSYIPQSRGCGENIASWARTPREPFEGWMNSPGHRDNILEPRFTHIGIGIIEGADGGYWWVQQFVAL